METAPADADQREPRHVPYVRDADSGAPRPLPGDTNNLRFKLHGEEFDELLRAMAADRALLTDPVAEQNVAARFGLQHEGEILGAHDGSVIPAHLAVADDLGGGGVRPHHGGCTDLHRLCAGDQFLDESVVHALMHDEPRRRGALLSGATECTAKRDGGCQIEVGTGVCHTIEDARKDLKVLRKTVASVAGQFGLAPLAVSCHPTADWKDQHHTDRDRYNALRSDLAGVSRMEYPPNIRVIRIPCTGRMSPKFFLAALNEGADAVWVSG